MVVVCKIQEQAGIQQLKPRIKNEPVNQRKDLFLFCT
jgi:hypothetical protein